MVCSDLCDSKLGNTARNTAPIMCIWKIFWAPSQYPKRRLSVRSRKVSKPRDLYSELSDRSEIWQALRQQCCRCACQISKRYDNLKYQSRGSEALRDLTKRRLFGYWDGAQIPKLSTVDLYVKRPSIRPHKISTHCPNIYIYIYIPSIL